MGAFSTVEILIAAAMVALFVAMPIWNLVRDRSKNRRDESDRDKSEAMFPALFPELQPLFHPRNVQDYVKGRLDRRKAVNPGEWADPPGFSAARMARLTKTEKGETTVLLDARQNVLGEFLFNADDRPSVLATLRLGKGKFTVKQRPHKVATVTYWHPDREFAWNGERIWEFKTKVADEPIRSDSDGMSWSSHSSSSSSSSSSARVAGAAALVGAGGAFDGGGASQSWDNAPATGDGDSRAEGSAGFAADQDASSSDSGSNGSPESSTSY